MERNSERAKEGNLISVWIKPNLFLRVTETARCYYADIQYVHGWREDMTAMEVELSGIITKKWMIGNGKNLESYRTWGKKDEIKEKEL